MPRLSPRGYQRFFAKLKRRQVFKVAAVYGAVAFAVIEGADLIFEAFAVPRWAFTMVTAVVLLGFPIALVLAWAFETSPEGVKRTEPARRGELDAIVGQPGVKRWPAGVLALVGTLLLLGAGWWSLGPGGSGDAVHDSIAVLPFANMSGDPDNEYFSDGLAEELLNALAGIEGLKVAARTSAFAFKGRNADVREIGRALNVETVLEGSVRKAGDRVRITAQLIDVSDGYHIWSQEYDRRLDDIFAVQDELARSIVDALAVSLGMDEKRDLYGRRFGLTADRLGDAAESWARLTGIPDPARLRVIGAGVVDSTLRKAALEAVAGLSVEVDREIWYRDGVLAKLWMAYDEFERALDHLERAFAAEDPTLGTIGVDPVWDPVRQDPRYQRIIEALRLPNGHFPDR